MPNIDQVQLPDGSQYNLKDNTSGYVTAGYVDDVIDGLTKANVGLGNVDNTSDLNKPVSTAQQTALNGKTDTTVIAPTEATTTASRRYEIGEQFILNGVLYTATAVIASGDTIIVNTNCDLSESITSQIDNIDLSSVTPKTDIAYVESGTTASQAYTLGQLLYVHGTLYRAKTAISSGETFTVDTNIEAVTIGEHLTNNPPLTANDMRYVVRNGVLILSGSESLTGGSTSWTSIGTLPVGYRPKEGMYGVATAGSGAFASVLVNANGIVEIRHTSNSTYTYYFSMALDLA